MPSIPRTRLFLAAVGVFVVVLGVRHARKVADDRSAFRRWQPQIQALDEGVDLSAKFNYPNPPIMAVLLEPLAWLPPVPAAMTWFAFEVVFAGLSLFWVIRLVEARGVPMPDWARALVVLCSLKPIADELAHGNVNLFILFLVVAALTAQQRGWGLRAGVLLALAIACKTTPLLFVPYFAWKRSWRLLGGVLVGLALFTYPGVVPSARLGVAENGRQLASWYDGMVRPYLVEGRVTSSHINQSLPGVIARLGTHSPSFTVWVDRVRPEYRYDNLLDLSPQVAKAVAMGCMFAFVALVMWTCRGRPAHAGEYALIVLGMLLFSERTWKHHCVVLMLPFAVVIHQIARGRDRHALSTILLLALSLTLLPGLNPGHERNTVADSPGFAKMAQVYGAYTAAFLLLLVGVVLVPVRRRSPAEGWTWHATPRVSGLPRIASQPG